MPDTPAILDDEDEYTRTERLEEQRQNAARAECEWWGGHDWEPTGIVRGEAVCGHCDADR